MAGFGCRPRQTLVFETAAYVFDQVKPGWSGKREHLLGQLVPLVERFLGSEKLVIRPAVYARDPLRRRILLALNLIDVVQHLFEGIRAESTESRELVLDREKPLRATGDMVPWWTAKPCHEAERSHINFCVHDSTWEASEAFRLDRDPHVAAWAKNEHLGFEIHYVYQGAVRRYRPDFLIRLTNGTRLVLEVKGRDAPQNRTKRQFLAEWIDAVNEDGRFGRWAWNASFTPSDVPDLLERHGIE